MRSAVRSATGQRGGLLDAHLVRQRRQPRGRHGRQLGPAGLLGERHDTGARRRAGAVGGLLDDDAGDVLARAPVTGAGREQGELAPVDGEGPDRDERLVGEFRRGCWRGDASAGGRS